MSVIDKVKKHFNDQSSKTIIVEEWDATFVVRPMNLDEVRRFLEKQKQNSIEAVVDLMIMKLLKEDGETKAFKLEDKKTLLTNADPKILNRIAEQIGDDTSIASEKKKLRQDHHLYSIYQLAELLHKSVEEIKCMSVEEFNGWIAYFQIKDEKANLKGYGK